MTASGFKIKQQYKPISCIFNSELIKTKDSHICINDFSNIGPESLLRIFKRSFQGFVVKLTEDEARKMASGWTLIKL